MLTRLRLFPLLFILCLSCKTTQKTSQLQAEFASEQRAAEIHKAVVNRLKTDAELKGAASAAWFEDKIALESDWIIQTPEDYWGKEASELPLNLTCKSGDKGCLAGYERFACEVDSDCTAVKGKCLSLNASVSKPGNKPLKMCSGSGDSLLERYYRTMVGANEYLDVVTLALPINSFYTTFVNALSMLSHKEKVPKVRILLSSKETRTFIYKFPPAVVLRQLVADIKAAGGKVERLNMDIGYLNYPLYFTWNHSKIVLADGERVIQGGHNFYAPDYTSDFPVFDLSMEFRGQGAKGVQSFVNHIWQFVTYNSSLVLGEGHSAKAWASHPEQCSSDPECSKTRIPKDKGVDQYTAGKLLPPNSNPVSKGTIPVIGVSQLGGYSTSSKDVTDKAFEALFDAAKDSILIAQEDVFSSIPVPVIGKLQYKTSVDRSSAMVHLIKKIAQNDKLKIRIAQTAQYAPGDPDGYGMVKPQDAQARIIESAVQVAKDLGIKAPVGKTMAQYMCSKFEIAPWRFTKGVRKFANGKDIGSHPKLIIIDEASFYLGSYNLYPSNLVEFGLVVSDAKATQELMEKYWNPIWSASEPDKLDCNRPDSELLKAAQ